MANTVAKFMAVPDHSAPAGRLPTKFRLPILVHDTTGLTHKEIMRPPSLVCTPYCCPISGEPRYPPLSIPVYSMHRKCTSLVVPCWLALIASEQDEVENHGCLVGTRSFDTKV